MWNNCCYQNYEPRNRNDNCFLVRKLIEYFSGKSHWKSHPRKPVWENAPACVAWKSADCTLSWWMLRKPIPLNALSWMVYESKFWNGKTAEWMCFSRHNFPHKAESRKQKQLSLTHGEEIWCWFKYFSIATPKPTCNLLLFLP